MPIFELGRCFSSQKSCVKIWFGLDEPFKSYRDKKKKIIINKIKQVKPLVFDLPGGGLTIIEGI